MLLEKIELFNYGIFKGNHTIDFPKYIDNRTITLIGGLNGRGKTTLLEAIFLVLYGRRSLKFLQDERTSYSDYLRNHMNKGAQEKQASITLTIVLDENKSDHIMIKRSWSNDNDNISDSLIAYKNGAKDSYLSENWDYFIEELLPLNISRFFFFDNEKISQIADDDSFENVKDSIKALLGLTTVDNLIGDIKKVIKQVTTTNKAIIQSEAYKEIVDTQQEIDQCEKDISKSVTVIGKLNREIGQARKQYADLENDFWNYGGDLRLKRDELETEKKQYSELLSMKVAEIEESVKRSFIPLLLCKPLLDRTFNQVQHDIRTQSAIYSSNIIEQLKDLLPDSVHEERKQKVILEFLSKAQKELIQSYTDKGLTELTPLAQNTFSTAISQAPQLLEDISNTIISIDAIYAKLVQLETRLSFESDSNDAKVIWEKIHLLTQDITRLDTKLHFEGERQQTLLNHLEMLQKRLNKHLLTGKTEEKNQEQAVRKLKYSSMTLEVMDAFKIRLQKKRIKELEQQIYECFSFMTQKESMLQQIEINSSTLDITLIDYRGGELLKNQLSAGEKQIFAVSILWGLAKCSGYQMPVIVDTPLGRLDSNHRTNFVKRYLPHASSQVVVLSTDEEINDKYYKMVEPYVNGVFLLDYDEKDSSTSIQTGYFGGHKT